MFRFNRLVLDDCHDMVRQGPPGSEKRSADPSGNLSGQWKKNDQLWRISRKPSMNYDPLCSLIHWFSKLCNDVWYRAGTPKDPVVYHQFPRFSPLRLTWPGTWNSFSLPLLPSRICRTTWPRCPWGFHFWTIPARNQWVITLVMNQVSRVSPQKNQDELSQGNDSLGIRSKLGLFMAGLTVPSWPRRGDLKVRSMLHLLPKGVASVRSSCHHSQLAVVPFRFGVTWSRNCWPSDDFLGRDHIHPGHFREPTPSIVDPSNIQESSIDHSPVVKKMEFELSSVDKIFLSWMTKSNC